MRYRDRPKPCTERISFPRAGSKGATQLGAIIPVCGVPSIGFEGQLRGNIDAPADGFVDGALLRVEGVHALRGLVILRICSQVVGDLNSLDDQDAIFVLVHLSYHVGPKESFTCWYLARFQRAAEGPR